MIATLKAKLCGAKLYSPSNLIEVLYVIKYTCKKTPRCKARGFCLQKLYVCDILVMKRQPPTRWVAEIRFVLKKPPLILQITEAAFLFGRLLFVLRNERQQCQYKQTKGHKILECEIYHRHHLHSYGMLATPPCNMVVVNILA